MAIQFQRLITPGEGVSTLLDFAPLAAGVRSYQEAEKANMIGNAAQRGNMAAAQEAMKQGQLDTGAQYQRLAMQDKQSAQADKDRQIKMLGGVAQAAKFEKDPARRALLWQTGLKRAGVNPADLDPEELDPMTGPDVFLAASGMAQDPRESQLMDLKLAGAQADLQRARTRATPAPEVRELFDEQGNPYTAQWTGSGWQRIGGVKAKPTAAETAVDKAFAKTYEEDFASGGIKDQEKNLSQLKEVRDTLIDPEGPNVTGPLVGRLPDIINAFINPAAIDTRERVEEVVQRNLRVILGAQFTNEEGKRLIARAYNPALPESVNAQRLTNLITAMDGALQAKKAAAQYYEEKGTLKGYRGPTQFSVNDFEQAIDGGGARSPNAMDLGDGFTVEVQQ